MGYALNKPILLSVIAKELGFKTKGDDCEIVAVSPVDKSLAGDITFAKSYLDVPEGVILITTSDTDFNGTKNSMLIGSHPRFDFIRVLSYLEQNIGFSTYSFDSKIHSSVKIGQNVVIESGCEIAENVVIEHNVVIHSGTKIGKNSRVRSCSSIGGDGFGFERLDDGTPLRFPHLGGVVIGEHVEIGSCTAVARGTLSDTIIKDYVKIDNLVHIAHNVLVKRGAFIIACAEISGGVVVGENAWVAPNSCTHQKINIGANALVGLGAVVTKDVPDNTVYAGNPAKKIRDL
ncbi:MAG TPA: UDP-3-O-(3-hydroxymyristoyl)glucosamine N-acyltransferase [Agitococcus sp.]|nr:UDP-3-O-(3-hydroxymyristoyl)glucosamine N-acyltransferase [Agitococcus sp.]